MTPAGHLTTAALIAVALLVPACTAEPATTRPTPSPEPSPSSPSPVPPSPGEPAFTQPLVIVTHHTRQRYDVFEEVALRIVEGRMRTWAELGVEPDLGVGPEPGAGPTALRIVAAPRTPTPDRFKLRSARAVVRTVAEDPRAVGVVPADAVGPEVQTIRVGGVHPLRQPARYPIRTPAETEQPAVNTMSVVGDIMLGRGVAAAARRAGDPSHALRPMQRRLAAADVTVGNLESTLSTAGTPTQGDDSFAASPRVVDGLRDAGFDAVSLANNHLGDFGPQALVGTVRRLRAGGVATFGAGAGPRQAWRPAIVERGGVRFGFLGFNAIGETPEVAPGQPGAVSVSMPPRTGPLDRGELGRFLAAVRSLDRRVDVGVVLPHWGTQYTNVPEPVQRRVARQLVGAGADLVVGGHPHWVQGAELVRGRLVVHSLGNFVFDMDFMEETQRGLLLELTYWGGELKGADFVPYRMDRSFAPRVQSREQGIETLRLMRATSGPAFRG